MWVRTQNSQRIVNSDHIVDIFIDKDGTKIYAELSIDSRGFILLGEYKDRDTCLEVLNGLNIIIGSTITGIEMPLDGEVDTWNDEMEEMAKAYFKVIFYQ